MSWRPDRAFLINLDRRPDRFAVHLNLERTLGFPIHRLSAVDGESDVLIPREWTASRQAWGNMMSHRRCLTGNEATDTIMVLEDDAVVPGNFRQLMTLIMAELPPHWESLYLGGQHIRAPRSISGHLSKPSMTIRTLGYILRGPAIEVALTTNERATTHWDMSLCADLSKRNSCFAVNPWLVHPSGSPSDIPDSIPYP